MPKSLFLSCVTILCLALAVPHAAMADSRKGGWEHGKKGHKYKQAQRYSDGDCDYEYKSKSSRKGYTEKWKRKCKGGRGWGPPPWAPAHGYRAKQGGGAVQTAYVPPFDLDAGRCNRDLLGGLLGGAAGAAIGSQIGDGGGRTAAIIGGTILGALVGGSIGRMMDDVDQNCIGQALEHAPDGQDIVWNDPQSGAQYQVTPTQTFQQAGGQYCREYTAASTVGGRAQQVYGTACRQPDGSWRLMN